MSIENFDCRTDRTQSKPIELIDQTIEVIDRTIEVIDRTIEFNPTFYMFFRLTLIDSIDQFDRVRSFRSTIELNCVRLTSPGRIVEVIFLRKLLTVT